MRIHNFLPAFAALIFVGFGSLFTGVAQNYYLVKTQGVDSEYPGVASGDEILGGTIGSFNDQMSAAQTLPFAFNFYGTPVTQYRASDNGYITFDIANTTSVAVNTTLPDAASPTSAIFAYWDDFELNTAAGQGTVDAIITYTTGDPGNRVHVIQWRSVSRVGLPGGQNFVYMGIRLYENSNSPWDFDIIHQWTRPQATGLISATIGCQNATGTLGYMVAGSPNIDLDGPTVNTTPPLDGVDVYGFKFGTQPANDTYLKGISVPDLVKQGDNYNLTGSLFNIGSAPITSVTIDYSVDGGAAQSFSPSISGGSLAPNAKLNFLHTTPYVPSNAGSFENLKVYVSQVNGGIDANPDSAADKAFVNLGIRADKKVFFEEFSTAPCQFCPDGAVVIEGMKTAYGDNMIVAQHHAGFGQDAMTIQAHRDYATAFAAGAPTATVDRVYYEGEGDVAISRSIWQARVGDELSKASPVNVNVETYFNTGTRMLEINTDIEFVDYALPGDLRLTVMLTEAVVTGSGSGYDQVNFYNNQGGHAYAGAGNPIIGYEHRDVARELLTATWGDALGVPALTPGTTKGFTHNFTIPATYDWDEISAVAVISYFDTDVRKRQVLNSNAQLIQERGVGIEDNLVAEGFSASIFPVPAHGATSIRMELGEQANMQIDLLNAMGQKVAPVASEVFTPGKHDLTFDAGTLASGIYFVRFISEKGVATHKFVVTK